MEKINIIIFLMGFVVGWIIYLLLNLIKNKVNSNFKYPEAKVQSRPAGAEVEQPPIK